MPNINCKDGMLKACSLNWKMWRQTAIITSPLYYNGNTRGAPKNQKLFIKNYLFILTCLNFRHLPSALHFTEYTYRERFHLCSKQFLDLLMLMPFHDSVIFCLTSSTSAKHFPLMTFFIWRQTNKKSHLGQDWVNRKGRAWRHAGFFLVKNCWTLSVLWAGHW